MEITPPPRTTQVTLGIDPGYAIVGFGLIASNGSQYQHLRHGAITTPVDMDMPQRLLIIHQDLAALIDAQKPDAMAVEKLFFNSNTTTAMGVSQARGVILLTAAMAALPVYEYSPSEIKQAVVGYGKAEKAQMMEMTRALLHLPARPKPDDAADALAIAICHAHTAGSGLNNI